MNVYFSNLYYHIKFLILMYEIYKIKMSSVVSSPKKVTFKALSPNVLKTS